MGVIIDRVRSEDTIRDQTDFEATPLHNDMGTEKENDVFCLRYR